MGSRSLLALVIGVLLVVMIVGQRLFGWLPADAGGLNTQRIVGLCLVVFLLYLATTREVRPPRRLRGESLVVCARCETQTTELEWHTRGACPACGGSTYEYAGRPATLFARYLPGQVEVTEETVPEPAEPTPVARRPRPPVGRLEAPVELARTRLGRRAQRRIRERLTESMAARDAVLRI